MRSTVHAWYDDPSTLISAVDRLRSAGFSELEAYTPFPVAELPEAMRLPRSPLATFAFVVGLLAAAGTYALQWLLNAYLYPIDVGARPPHFPLSYVPICFEVGVLGAALTVVIGLLRLGGLGRLYHPVFEVPDYALVTRDRMLLELCVPPGADVGAICETLRASGASDVIEHGEDACP